MLWIRSKSVTIRLTASENIDISSRSATYIYIYGRLRHNSSSADKVKQLNLNPNKGRNAWKYQSPCADLSHILNHIAQIGDFCWSFDL